MESYNLKTANAYINNLLLARGLLRDGKPIEFAHPSRGEGGKEVTMAQIINLVHDLVLKRDRDQEHRESIAATIRTLRADASRQTIAIEKLQTRNEDLSRQLSLVQSQERSARTALRTAESSARSLREEMLRLKTTVQQVRTSCANDVRKRDIQIQKLKSHLTSQQRGNKAGMVGASITINPGATGLNSFTGSARDDSLDTEDPEYSLKQETTEFLTQLSQSLSDENDNLIGLVRSTLMTLKDLQGMPEEQRAESGEGMSTIGEEAESPRQDMLHTLPTSYETLSSDMDAVLDNLKNLLTNPNFVSVEEVEMREEEILRLRAGWEKMESRWRETLSLLDSWRKRMASGGDTINLDDLKMGMGLGEDLETVNGEGVSTIVEEDEDEVASSVFEEEVEDMQDAPSVEADDIPDKAAGRDIFKLKLQPNQPALKESNGNVQSLSKSPRKVAFSPSIPTTPSLADENAEASGIDLVDVGKPARPASSKQSEGRASRRKSQDTRTPVHLTVHDKLKVVQAEADAAAMAEQQRSNKAAKVKQGEDGVEKYPSRSSPIKTRVSGRPKRRKSTLTPEELENLLGFD
ncbi:hypothetical protein BS50DRAFT_493166 [Corynespora cassiicola Philippines]|uniref:NIMA interactive protein n=1 Tax=Corynespora cassiicola Philippines TaxID=1448308 RepID=A0A2T2NNR3_CORCC|nr:hypothetical protein BS50DRAFT_493166 [Corynespora cassiicola Philippines]